MTYCEHQFILIEQKTRKPKGSNVAIGAAWHDQYGACVGCPICGEVRIVWANGEIEIIYLPQDNAQTSDTQN